MTDTHIQLLIAPLIVGIMLLALKRMFEKQDEKQNIKDVRIKELEGKCLEHDEETEKRKEQSNIEAHDRIFTSLADIKREVILTSRDTKDNQDELKKISSIVALINGSVKQTKADLADHARDRGAHT